MHPDGTSSLLFSIRRAAFLQHIKIPHRHFPHWLIFIFPAHKRAKYPFYRNVAMVSSINPKLSETGMTWILNVVAFPHFTIISLYAIP